VLRIGISCFPGVGGSGVVAAELGKALARAGHEVHFVTSDVPFRVEELGERLQFHPVTPMPYPVFQHPPYVLALATRLAEVAQRQRLDVIHAHYAIPHSTAAYLARMSIGGAVRVVTTLHGTDTRLVGLDPSYRHIVRFSLEESHAVTAVSQHLAVSSAQDFELSQPVRVIYNFVDTAYWRPGRCFQLRQMIAADDEPVVMHVSNLRPIKRVLDIVRAHSLVTAATGARLVIVGDGPQREEAEHLAQCLGIAGKVNFLGARDDVAPYLSCADVYVMASEQESFGMSVLEAMSCGVAVVAPRVGGLPELVADGATGVLTPPGQIEPLAEAVIGLLRDHDRRRAFGAAGRRRAVTCFDTAVIVPQYLEVYEQTLVEMV
jgi:N-acetyl-alpha-D-glucosaminyl L-malate synthase BshA